MLRIIELSSQEVVFRIQHEYFPLARALNNAMVRGVQQDVNTLAMDLVLPRRNESPRDESFISHRLGWVILDSTKAAKQLRRFDECTCAHGCPLCCVHFWIDTIGTKEKPYVSTLDLQTTCEWARVQERDLMEDKPSDDRDRIEKSVTKKDSVLFCLDEGKVAQFDILARLGSGRDHAKWSPVCAPGMWYRAKVEVGDLEDIGQLAKVCPRGVFHKDGIRADLCNFCGECTKWAKKNDKKVTVKENGDVFVRFTTKQLSPRHCVLATVDSLILRMKKVMSSLKLDYGEDPVDLIDWADIDAEADMMEEDTSTENPKDQADPVDPADQADPADPEIT